MTILTSEPIINENSKKVYSCPTSFESFTNVCPIRRCPANISHIRKENGGCAYMNVHNGTRLDKFALSFLFKTTVKIANDSAKIGRLRIRKALFLASLLDELPPLKYPTCPKCGIQKASHGNCLNIKKCNKRRRFAERNLNKFPFKLKTLELNKEKLFNFGLALYSSKMNNLRLVEKTSTPLHRLIGVKRSTLIRLKKLAGVARNLQESKK